MYDNLLDIILVEDNPYDIDLTLDVFKDINLANRVKVLRDGEEAIEYIFRQGRYADSGMDGQPTLILLDIKLPKIDGLDILRRIRADERTKTIPVVILASSSTEKERLRSITLGVNSYIVKPVAFDALVKALSQIGLYWAVLNKAAE